MCKFLMQFLRHPRSVGAIAPSGKNLSEKMVEPINFRAANVIVEYGAGTGSFTRELLKRKREDTFLISIEKNDKFVKILKKEFPEEGVKNFRIVHGGAEDACEILALHGYGQADYVVSGLPFTSLPKDLSVKIFGETQKAIGNGKFITFQYSKVKQKFFEEYFDFVEILHVKKNLPPAYVFVLENKKTKEEQTK